MDDILKNLCLLQGLFYLVTGLWPLFSMRSFIAVTGPKTDLWLVRTVGLLVAVIGTTLIISGLRHSIGLEIRFLAMASALSVASIDFIYALRDRISNIYLFDGVVELGLAAGWILMSGVSV